MNDEQGSSDSTTPDLEPTPPAATSDETVEIPAAAPSAKPSWFSRSRQLVAAGGAGLLIVGGLAGFGIGRATGGDDGPRFARSGHFGPGQHGFGRPGQRDRGHFGGGQQRGQGFGPGQVPNGPSDGQPGGQPPQPTPSPTTKPS